MPNFAACDLCFHPLNSRLVDIQVSPATLVQISEEGDVVHRATGLRDYRLCGRCGGFLRDVLVSMTSPAAFSG